MELNLGIRRKLGGAICGEWQRLLIIAALVKNPTKGVSDPSVVGLEIMGFLRHLKAFVELIQSFGIKVSQIVQGENGVWDERQSFLISITRSVVIFHLLKHQPSHQNRTWILRILVHFSF